MNLRGGLWSTQRLARLGLHEDAGASRFSRFVLGPEEAPAFGQALGQGPDTEPARDDREDLRRLLVRKPAWAGDLDLSFVLAYPAECCIKLSVRTWDEYRS